MEQIEVCCHPDHIISVVIYCVDRVLDVSRGLSLRASHGACWREREESTDESKSIYLDRCGSLTDDCRAGARKLAQVRENSNFFRKELRKMGCEVLGDEDSPVMPVMLYNPAKIPAFSRECFKRNVRLPFHYES